MSAHRGDITAALYGGPIRSRRRDRTGEIVDTDGIEAEVLGQPAVTLEMRAARYFEARQRYDDLVRGLSGSELAALDDAVRGERLRRP